MLAGGDEFAILCPETTLDQAIALAERVRRTLADTATDPPTTVSVGVAQSAAGANAHEFLAAADDALYRAKRLGRDRVALTERWHASCSP